MSNYQRPLNGKNAAGDLAPATGAANSSDAAAAPAPSNAGLGTPGLLGAQAPISAQNGLPALNFSAADSQRWAPATQVVVSEDQASFSSWTAAYNAYVQALNASTPAIGPHADLLPPTRVLGASSNRSITGGPGATSVDVTTTANTVDAAGLPITFENGAGGTVTSNGSAISLKSNTNVAVAGTSDPITVIGSGNQASVSSGTANVQDNAGGSLFGSNDAITLGSNDTVSVTGASDAVTVVGSNNTLGVSGGASGADAGWGLLGAPSSSPDSITAAGSTADTFVFAPHFGQDALAGFVVTGTGHDVPQFNVGDFNSLSPGQSQAADLAALIAHGGITQSGSDTIIADSFGDTLNLKATAAASLTANPANFAFK